ncbi:MAG: glyoxalase [Saprospiraceae bacterium]|nr:glyoxalase [Saprospiraceae bacterium]
MNYKAKNIRTFIGAKNFEESKDFYQKLGFEIIAIPGKMVLIKVNEQLAFYLQEYYKKQWVQNSMIFLEVDDIFKCYEDVKSRKLDEQYKYVRLSEIKTFDWGKEFFLHDPSGVLWHFGCFN